MFLESGNYERALRLGKTSFEILKTFGIWESEITLQLMMNLGLLHLNLGQLSEARQHFDQALAYAGKFNSHLMYKAHYLSALLSLHQGRYAEALLRIDRSLQACDAFRLPKNETCEIALELYLDLGARDPFERTLETYRKEIQTMELGFLQPSLANYEIEGGIRFGVPAVPRDKVEKLLEASLRQGLLPEAFRAARSLFIMTGDRAFLDRIRELLQTLKKRIHYVELALLEYIREPDAPNRRRALHLLKDSPYGALALRAHQAMALHAATPRQRRAHEQEARRLRQELYQGLPPELIPAEA
jgi:tetratricopeptide (TPR) repeat protein